MDMDKEYLKLYQTITEQINQIDKKLDVMSTKIDHLNEKVIKLEINTEQNEAKRNRTFTISLVSLVCSLLALGMMVSMYFYMRYSISVSYSNINNTTQELKDANTTNNDNSKVKNEKTMSKSLIGH